MLLTLSGSQHSENFGSSNALKTPWMEDIEIVRKQVEKANQLLQKEMEPYG